VYPFVPYIAAAYPGSLSRYGRFAGIGVRLEDDIAITATGPEVMSNAVPLDPGTGYSAHAFV
jgi:hypothetical protein